ncbi:MAG: T9SS type A sorting domain-containing protein, partial [Bacteroidia bacterium]
YSGSCDGTLVTCLNNATASQGYEGYFNNNFVVGQTYFMRILNTSANISIRNFNVGVQKFPTPLNDLCANATTIAPARTCISTPGSFSGAFLDGNASACAPNASQDVWYKFVATDPALYLEVNHATNIGLDVAMEIYSGGCDGTIIACQNNATASQGYESYSGSNFVVGQTYFMRILNTSANVSVRNFNVCVQGELLGTDAPVVNSVSITPNPVKDVLKISNLDGINNYTYQIINLQGQSIAKGKLTQDVIYTDGLSKGFYILRLSNSTKEFVSKFIKD